MNNLINGVTHCSFFCNDFEKMVHFYRDILEIPVAFTLRNEDGSPWLTYLKISDRQFIELFNTKYTGDNKWGDTSMGHFSLLVKDIFAAVHTLEGKGLMIYDGPSANKRFYRVPYRSVAKPACCGSLTAWVQDPEGNEIELMQYTASSMQITCANN